jgi:hypothetical protein
MDDQDKAWQEFVEEFPEGDNEANRAVFNAGWGAGRYSGWEDGVQAGMAGY